MNISPSVSGRLLVAGINLTENLGFRIHPAWSSKLLQCRLSYLCTWVRGQCLG